MTYNGAGSTVTFTVPRAFLNPSLVASTVIEVVPCATAVTNPSEETVAIESLLVEKETFESAGSTV